MKHVLNPSSRNAATGMALIELLVVVVIFAVVSAALLAVYISTAQYFSFATRSATLQTDIASSLHVFLDDVSALGWIPETVGPPVANPAAAIITLPSTNGCFTTSDAFTFIGDVAPLGDSNRITYQLDASNNLTRALQSWSAGAWTPSTPAGVTIAANVSCFKVSVENASRTPITTNFQNARYVATSLATTDPSVRGAIPLGKELSGTVALRNFVPTPAPLFTPYTPPPGSTSTPGPTSTPTRVATSTPTPPPTPSCVPNGGSCSANGDCCNNKCKGSPKTCQ